MTREEVIDTVVLAINLVRSRMCRAPSYGVYVHALTQLEKMQALLLQQNLPSPEHRRFVDIGLMAAKELESSDPELADALMLAEYSFKNLA